MNSKFNLISLNLLTKQLNSKDWSQQLVKLRALYPFKFNIQKLVNSQFYKQYYQKFIKLSMKILVLKAFQNFVRFVGVQSDKMCKQRSNPKENITYHYETDKKNNYDNNLQLNQTKDNLEKYPTNILNNNSKQKNRNSQQQKQKQKKYINAYKSKKKLKINKQDSIQSVHFEVKQSEKTEILSQKVKSTKTVENNDKINTSKTNSVRSSNKKIASSPVSSSQISQDASQFLGFTQSWLMCLLETSSSLKNCYIQLLYQLPTRQNYQLVDILVLLPCLLSRSFLQNIFKIARKDQKIICVKIIEQNDRNFQFSCKILKSILSSKNLGLNIKSKKFLRPNPNILDQDTNNQDYSQGDKTSRNQKKQKIKSYSKKNIKTNNLNNSLPILKKIWTNQESKQVQKIKKDRNFSKKCQNGNNLFSKFYHKQVPSKSLYQINLQKCQQQNILMVQQYCYILLTYETTGNIVSLKSFDYLKNKYIKLHQNKRNQQHQVEQNQNNVQNLFPSIFGPGKIRCQHHKKDVQKQDQDTHNKRIQQLNQNQHNSRQKKSASDYRKQNEYTSLKNIQKHSSLTNQMAFKKKSFVDSNLLLNYSISNMNQTRCKKTEPPTVEALVKSVLKVFQDYQPNYEVKIDRKEDKVSVLLNQLQEWTSTNKFIPNIPKNKSKSLINRKQQKFDPNFKPFLKSSTLKHPTFPQIIRSQQLNNRSLSVNFYKNKKLNSEQPSFENCALQQKNIKSRIKNSYSIGQNSNYNVNKFLSQIQKERSFTKLEKISQNNLSKAFKHYHNIQQPRDLTSIVKRDQSHEKSKIEQQQYARKQKYWRPIKAPAKAMFQIKNKVKNEQIVQENSKCRIDWVQRLKQMKKNFNKNGLQLQKFEPIPVITNIVHDIANLNNQNQINQKKDNLLSISQIVQKPTQIKQQKSTIKYKQDSSQAVSENKDIINVPTLVFKEIIQNGTANCGTNCRNKIQNTSLLYSQTSHIYTCCNYEQVKQDKKLVSIVSKLKKKTNNIKQHKKQFQMKCKQRKNAIQSSYFIKNY